MCELISLIYRLVISKSVKVASSKKQEWQYGAPQFLLKVRYAGTVRFFGMVRVRYVGTVRIKS